MKERIYLLLAVLIIFIFFIPFLKNPKYLTDKDNDLGRTYFPIISFIQKSVYTYNQVPLWRPDQLMGESFVANPISSIFYPANIIFLIKNTSYAAVLYLFFHFVLAAAATYLLSRAFNLSQQASSIAAVFYALSFKMLVHLEAGHMTMIAAFSYFPLVFLAVKKLLGNTSFTWLTIGALSQTFMFFTYPTIFYYSLIFIVIYWLYKKPVLTSPKIILKNYLPLFLMLALTLGFSAPALFPQLEFVPLSTRASLKLEDVAIPVWNVKLFVQSLIFPFSNLGNIDHEAFLYLGVTPSALAAIGFLKLRTKQKILLLIFAFTALLFAAGTSTPLFEFFYSYLPFLKYSRVTTRFWFIIALITALLGAYGVNKLKSKTFIFLILFLFFMETMFIFQKRLSLIPNLSFNDPNLYDYLAAYKEKTRTYCTTHCLNPQQVSKNNLEILDGENPIQDAAFVTFLQKAGSYNWNQFAVIFPPYQVWQAQNPPIPNAELLGQANVKHVASTYPIKSPDYVLENEFGNIILYKNNKFQPRAHFLESNDAIRISYYSPNKISLNFSQSEMSRTLIFSENYYPGWIAYAENIKLKVEPFGVFRKVVVPANFKSLDLKFQPQSYAIGKTITLATITFLVLYYFRNKFKNG